MLSEEREQLIQKLLGYYPYPRSYYDKIKDSSRLLAMCMRAENKHAQNKPALKGPTLEELEAEARSKLPQRVTVNGHTYLRTDNGQYVLLGKDDL